MKGPSLEQVLKAFHAHGLITAKRGDGNYESLCPFAEDATHGAKEKLIIYAPNGEYRQCWIKCYDQGCEGRETTDYFERLGLYNGEKETPERKPKPDTWPVPLTEAALYGLAGDVVRAISPSSESDQAAILTQFLTAFGSLVSRSPHFTVEGDKHHTNLFVLLVGATSRGRKGTSWGRVLQIFEHVLDPWALSCVVTGLSSGEGLIWAVRDPIFKRVKTGKGASAIYEEVKDDPGVSDKRLMVLETEFANTLRVMSREGNTLSPIIRQAWDRGDLRALTKNCPAKATGAHISIIGHITQDELIRNMDRTELINGFANRFIFTCVKRSKLLPSGGSIPNEEISELASRVARAWGKARVLNAVNRDDEAQRLWEAAYPSLTEEKPGMLGAVTSRCEAQVMRLALIYALLDEATVIQSVHLEAALALWEYSEASAKHIFGTATGDRLADDIYSALQEAEDGLTKTAISEALGRNRSAIELDRALDILKRAELVKRETQPTGKRPATVWYAL